MNRNLIIAKQLTAIAKQLVTSRMLTKDFRDEYLLARYIDFTVEDTPYTLAIAAGPDRYCKPRDMLKNIFDYKELEVSFKNNKTKKLVSPSLVHPKLAHFDTELEWDCHNDNIEGVGAYVPKDKVIKLIKAVNSIAKY